MVQQIGFVNNANKAFGVSQQMPAVNNNQNIAQKSPYEKGSLLPYNLANLVPLKTRLETQDEQNMYSQIVSLIQASKENSISPNDKVSVTQKLDTLLRNGKLLSSSSNDNSTTLKNLYDILTLPRCYGLDNAKILAQTIDALYDPTVITQNFGDIPNNIKNQILSSDDIAQGIKANPELMDVEGSGTCVAASVEFHMANKHPAEFARWISGLTSKNQEVIQKVRLEALSKNILDGCCCLP